MSVNVYHEGDHPSGYLGVRVVVGSKTRGDEASVYFNFRVDGKPISMTKRKAVIAKAKRRESELIQERGGDFRFKTNKTATDFKPKKYKDLETNIRGLSISFLIKTSRLASGEIGYYPTCIITSEVAGVRKAFTMRHFDLFDAKWLAAAKYHAKQLGLNRLGNGWSKPPISKKVFQKHIKRLAVRVDSIRLGS